MFSEDFRSSVMYKIVFFFEFTEISGDFREPLNFLNLLNRWSLKRPIYKPATWNPVLRYSKT